MKGTALPKIQRWDLMSCGFFFVAEFNIINFTLYY